MKNACITSFLLSIGAVGAIDSNFVEDTIRELQGTISYLDQGALNDGASYQSKAMNAAKNALTDSAKLASFIDENPSFGSNFDWDEKHVKNFYGAATIFYSTNGVSNDIIEELEDDNFELSGWTNQEDWTTNPDYCSWFGIKCFLNIDTTEAIAEQTREQNIIEIELFNNTLMGTWPLEIALLGESLATIDLYDNFHHYMEDFTWFQDMGELQYLYFGTTSWRADGIPSELNELTKLRQLDCSYTYWSDGAISGEAFADLDELEYIDMGDNIYTEVSGQNVPDELRDLDSLIRLYFDNVRFINEERDDVRFPLDFITEMDSIIEAWFDFTKFEGSIPKLPSTLKSFSCLFCGLSGNLDNLVESDDLSLDRLWLTGNSLTGTIPDDFGDVHNNMRIIFLEGNDFSSSKFPESICDQVTAADSNALVNVGGDEELCNDILNSCCTCIGMDCGNMPDPTPAPTVNSPQPDIPFGICFSGDNSVTVENVGAVKMSELSIGDMVLVGENQYEPIYSFGHKNDNASAEYIKISTYTTKNPIELSAAHMISTEDDRFVPASSIKKGDMIQLATGESATVKNTKTVTREGAYAPFTSSGKLVVNDVVASNYIAYQGSEYLKIGEMQFSLSYQWIAHTFNSAHRLAVLMGCGSESYTAEGVSQWVDMPHKLFQWVLEQNAFVSISMIFASLAFFMLTSFIEQVLMNPVLMTAVFGMSTVIAYKKIGRKQN